MCGFCPDCDVTMDLHDGPDSCEYAERKADALAGMTRMLFGGFAR